MLAIHILTTKGLGWFFFCRLEIYKATCVCKNRCFEWQLHFSACQMVITYHFSYLVCSLVSYERLESMITLNRRQYGLSCHWWVLTWVNKKILSFTKTTKLNWRIHQVKGQLEHGEHSGGDHRAMDSKNEQTNQQDKKGKTRLKPKNKKLVRWTGEVKQNSTGEDRLSK